MLTTTTTTKKKIKVNILFSKGLFANPCEATQFQCPPVPEGKKLRENHTRRLNAFAEFTPKAFGRFRKEIQVI